MNFTSLSFVFFFLPACYLLFYFGSVQLARWNDKISELTCRRLFLLIASALFVLLLDRPTFYVLMVVLIIGYLLKQLIARSDAESVRGKVLFVLSLIISLIPLLTCKYLHFFLGIVKVEDTWSGSMIVPVGISFFTFRQIMVIIDTRTRNLKMDAIDYFSYVMFFS